MYTIICLAKHFISPSFELNDGEITWYLLYKVHEKNEKLQATYRAAPKLDFKTLHPGSNKQLNIFDPSTSIGIKTYFPKNHAAAEFLHLFHLVDNFNFKKSIFQPSDMSCCSNWIETWEKSQLPGCNSFTLTKQTSHA